MRYGLIVLLVVASFTHARSARAQVAEKKVLAFYYTWYGNPEVSGSWIHWPEGGHDPETLLPTGLPDTGTTNHPSLGLYDSMDPDLMRKHLAMAEEAGIDAFIATWWGQKDRHDQVFERLLDVAKETKLRLTVYYERVPENDPDLAREDLEYIVSRYTDHPAFFRHGDSPVIFIYGRAMHQIPRSDWEEIATEFREKGVALIADSRKPVGGFTGTHVYNPVVTILAGTDMGDFYREDVDAALMEDQLYAATVIPGYDDSNIGRKTPIVADRRGGDLYDEQWRDALSADPDWIIITSWNELHEGSEIEPTHEHGRQYLEATARWTEMFKSGRYITFTIDRERVAAGDYVKMSAGTRAKGKLAVEIPGGAFKVTPMKQWKQGGIWKIGVPEAAALGIHPLRLGGTIDGEPVPEVDFTIEVVPPITCSLESVGADPHSLVPSLVCTVRNHRRMQNTAVVEMNSQALSRTLTKRVSLRPDSEDRVHVQLPASEVPDFFFSEKKPPVRVTVTEEKTGTPASKEGRLPVALAVRAKGAIECDGSLGEWENVPLTVLDESMYRNRGDEGRSDPVSAVSMTQWDEEFFYVAVEVTDRVHHQTIEGFFVWQEDNLQIAFDPFMDGGDAYRDDDREFGLTLTKNGPGVWRWTPPLEPGDESLGAIRFGAKHEGKKTVYEAAIPWKLISPIMVARAGKAFGFSLAINNASPDMPPGVLRLSEGIIFAKTPSKFPRWTLVEME